jgi:3D (Asp-Asp-Asp) domain-containing protein
MKKYEKFIYFVCILICLLALVLSGLETAKLKMENKHKDVIIKEQNEQIEMLEATLKSQPNYIGEFTITYYCSCDICCGKNDGVTYSGTHATEGRTIAVDPEVIPLGSVVIINGAEYIAEDVGGAIKGNRIDVFINSHTRALEAGIGQAKVFIMEE